MTELLDHAIARVCGLPAAVRNDIADARLVGEADGAALRLSAEDRAALEAADSEIACGAFASEAEMHEIGTKPIP